MHMSKSAIVLTKDQIEHLSQIFILVVDIYYVTAPDISVKAGFAWFLNFVID
jgi:hypothetical protein